MNKSESKYFSTAKKMDEAFLSLLESKDFAYITVKEICQRAGVNRSTFYLHYETVNDLLKECTEYMIGKFLAYMEHDSARFLSKIADCPLDELYLITPEYLIPYLNFIKENRRLFGTGLENSAILRLDKSYEGLLQHVITPILERYGVPKEQRNYVLAFNIQGIMAIISLWLKGECAEPTEYMCDVICRCVRRIEEK